MKDVLSHMKHRPMLSSRRDEANADGTRQEQTMHAKTIQNEAQSGSSRLKKHDDCPTREKKRRVSIRWSDTTSDSSRLIMKSNRLSRVHTPVPTLVSHWCTDLLGGLLSLILINVWHQHHGTISGQRHETFQPC